MCVKEFLGYSCGHCSMPYLRKCPVTDSNPTFPPCKFPADRPIYANENCHSCERVLWNAEVLRKEEEHRQAHKRRECPCEVIFDAEEREERERRLRPRGPKGKGKGKELARIEYGSRDESERITGVADLANISGFAAGLDGIGGIVDNTDKGPGAQSGIMEGGPPCPRQDWAPDVQMAAYQYVGYRATGTGNGQPDLSHHRGGAAPADNSQMNLVSFTQGPQQPFGDGGGRVDMNRVASGQGFPVGGMIPREYLWVGQLEIGEPGAGMKFYQQPEGGNMPVLADNIPPPPPPSMRPVFDKMPRVWQTPRAWQQRAKSEPPENISHPSSPTLAIAQPVTAAVAIAADVTEVQQQQQPAVVSSDMAVL